MKTIGHDAIWYQWTSPSAVQCDGKTFVGWVTRQGSIVAASLDHSSGYVIECAVAKHFNADDHAAPALIVRRSDKRILLIYTKHNDKILRWRVSAAPLDISSWGPEQTYVTERNCAYPQIAQLSEENGRVYVFFRHAIVGGDQRDWAFLTSDDEGQTFGNFRTLRTNFYSHGNGVLNPYTVMWSDGASRIDFASTNYEQLALGGSPNCIYHFYYQNGFIHKSDGTPTRSLSQLPITSEVHVSVVSSDRNVNLWDIARCADGGARHRLGQLRELSHSTCGEGCSVYFNRMGCRNCRRSWRAVSNNPGREWYSGGVCLSKTNADEVYLSIGGRYGQFTLSKWRRSSKGWERYASYQGDLTRKNFRPVSPVNGEKSGVEVLWVAGAYQDLQAYGPTSIVAYPGTDDMAHNTQGLRGSLRTNRARQILPNGAVDIVFDKTAYDTDRFFKDGTGFVVPPGIQAIRVSASVRFSAAVTNGFLNVVKNGKTHPGMGYAWGNGRILSAASAVLLVEPGDEFRCRVQAPGAIVEAHDATWFSIEVVE